MLHSCDCGLDSRKTEDGHELYYFNVIMLKRVVSQTFPVQYAAMLQCSHEARKSFRAILCVN